MDLEARPGRVLPRADRAEEDGRIADEPGASAAEHVARHRGATVPGAAEMPAVPPVLGREKVMARTQVVAAVAPEESKMPALRDHRVPAAGGRNNEGAGIGKTSATSEVSRPRWRSATLPGAYIHVVSETTGPVQVQQTVSCALRTVPRAFGPFDGSTEIFIPPRP